MGRVGQSIVRPPAELCKRRPLRRSEAGQDLWRAEASFLARYNADLGDARQHPDLLQREAAAVGVDVEIF